MAERPPARDHERYRDALAAYSLGALDPPEAASLERHLAGCANCRARLEWLRPAVDLLPASVEQLTPPRELRGRVLSDVRADARRSRAGSPRGFLRPGWRIRPAAALAAVALLAGALAAGYAIRGDEDPSVIAAQPTEAAPAGEVAVALEARGDEAILHVDRLPVLPEGRAYQAWIERAGKLAPSSVFRLAPDRTAEVALEGDLGGARRVLVTEEPARGSTVPSSPPLLSLRLS
jgi:anti-sigma-K factor RskA